VALGVGAGSGIALGFCGAFLVGIVCISGFVIYVSDTIVMRVTNANSDDSRSMTHIASDATSNATAHNKTSAAQLKEVWTEEDEDEVTFGKVMTFCLFVCLAEIFTQSQASSHEHKAMLDLPKKDANKLLLLALQSSLSSHSPSRCFQL
jgi:hypothetical protein